MAKLRRESHPVHSSSKGEEEKRSRERNVERKLTEKVTQWKEEDQAEREEDERRRMGTRGGQKIIWTMDIDDVDSWRRMILFWKRATMMKMIQKRLNL
jgi:hypothetical protein